MKTLFIIVFIFKETKLSYNLLKLRTVNPLNLYLINNNKFEI
jgi:hypothetical protein